MLTTNTKHSATFRIGGDLEVNRLGYSAMRITGRAIWEEPRQPRRRAGNPPSIAGTRVNFADTANSYGPDTSEQLIREAKYPCCGIGRCDQSRTRSNGAFPPARSSLPGR